jgi:DNA-binding NarL/FixJ family response regulator
MIMCAIDDLIFSIKLTTTARHLGVELFFERTAEGIVPRVREKCPSLVIFDLNSQKLAPLDAIAALKADADLRTIRTLGFVSHVDEATIAAAREAGIDQVMARSAFTARLSDILTAG